jgi:hypothetical protein
MQCREPGVSVWMGVCALRLTIHAIPEMTSITERRDDDIGGDDDIQIVPIKLTDSSNEIL